VCEQEVFTYKQFLRPSRKYYARRLLRTLSLFRPCTFLWPRVPTHHCPRPDNVPRPRRTMTVTVRPGRVRTRNNNTRPVGFGYAPVGRPNTCTYARIYIYMYLYISLYTPLSRVSGGAKKTPARTERVTPRPTYPVPEGFLFTRPAVYVRGKASRRAVVHNGRGQIRKREN